MTLNQNKNKGEKERPMCNPDIVDYSFPGCLMAESEVVGIKVKPSCSEYVGLSLSF